MPTYFKIPKTAGLIFILAFLILPGCGKSGVSGKDVIAYVNKEPVYEHELKYDLALKMAREPSLKITPEIEAEELSDIINRKLLIQKATAKGLAREPRFTDTIKTFWEQTLIRDLVNYKEKEFRNSVFVTEDEIKHYYNDMVKKGATEPLELLRPEIKKRIVEEKETRLFDDWFKSERAKAKIRIIKR